MSLLSRLFGRGERPSPGSVPAARGPLGTDSGLFAVWDHAAFAHVVDYDAWEPELLEDSDILRHVEAGALVPIGFGQDGAFEFEVRVGSDGAPAALTGRELRYLTVSSEPYKLVTGGTAFLSGIEHISGEPEAMRVMPLPLAAGTYGVTIHMIEWDAEPGAHDAAGGPARHALPDFVVLVNPATPGTPHRVDVQTFPDPPAAAG